MSIKRVLSCLMLAVCLAAATPALAEEFKAAQGWDFRLSPYYWLGALSGNITAVGVTADLASNTQTWPGSAASALYLQAEALKDRHFGLLAELSAVGIARSPSVPMASTNLTINAAAIDACALYRLFEAAAQPVGLAVDLFAGARIWTASMNISASAFGLGASTSASRTWVDPLVGARLVIPIGQQFEAGLRGAIGGFGIGTDLTWDACATVSWIFHPNARLSLGYRALALRDTSSAALGAQLDAVFHGPIVGLGLSF